MSFSIRQRCQKVAEYIQTKGRKTLRELAQETGLTIVLCLSAFLWRSLAVTSIQSRGGGKPEWAINV